MNDNQITRSEEKVPERINPEDIIKKLKEILNYLQNPKIPLQFTKQR